MTDPKGFLKFPRQEIHRRPPDERLRDWNEVDISPNVASADFLKTQSLRCMDCGVAFCQSDTGCPVHNLIPEWNSLVAQDRWFDAATKLLATNNFPEFTGRLCPAPCESACVLGVHSDPVNIKSLEWGIIEKAFSQGWVKAQPAKIKTGHAVAVIGSGPAGLAAAQQLARAGHAVTVFEKAKHLGGLLRYGIPDFKLQKNLIDRRLSQLEEEGIEFQTSTHFGVDVQLKDLKDDFDAVILATGAEAPRDLNILGRELNGIHFAMDYLTDQNLFLNSEIENLTINAHNKKVLILGGGDTGSDCLGTALRQGASQVLQFEIQPQPPKQRDVKTPWPYFPFKLKSSHAHEEGGLRQWSISTEAFLGTNGQVQKVKARRLDTLEDFILEADLVILALGFTGCPQSLVAALPDLQMTSRGTIQVDPRGLTSIDGVFACGDNQRGASLIVWAIAEGRKVASSIHHYLKNSSFKH